MSSQTKLAELKERIKAAQQLKALKEQAGEQSDTLVAPAPENNGTIPITEPNSQMAEKVPNAEDEQASPSEQKSNIGQEAAQQNENNENKETNHEAIAERTDEGRKMSNDENISESNEYISEEIEEIRDDDQNKPPNAEPLIGEQSQSEESADQSEAKQSHSSPNNNVSPPSPNKTNLVSHNVKNEIEDSSFYEEEQEQQNSQNIITELRENENLGHNESQNADAEFENLPVDIFPTDKTLPTENNVSPTPPPPPFIESIHSRSNSKVEQQSSASLEELDDFQLAKRPEPAVETVQPMPSSSHFKIKTHTFSHNCELAGLSCPDLSPLYNLFNLLSQTSLFGHYKSTRNSLELNELAGKFAETLIALCSQKGFKEIYLREILYIIHSTFELGHKGDSEALVCLCSGLLRVEALEQLDMEKVLAFVQNAGWFNDPSEDLADFLLLENPGLVQATLSYFLTEQTDSAAENIAIFLSKLIGCPRNIKAFFEFTLTLDRETQECQKFFELLSKVDLAYFNKPFDAHLTEILIELTFVPGPRLRATIINFIRLHVSHQDQSVLRKSPAFAELVFFLYLNKVYQSSSAAFSIDAYIKEMWAHVGKADIKSTLIDSAENFFSKYVELGRRSVQKTPKEVFGVAEEERRQGSRDFQLSILSVIMDLYDGFLPDDSLPRQLPGLISLFKALLNVENPRIDGKRILKQINSVLEDLTSRTVEAPLKDFYGNLFELISEYIDLFINGDAIEYFEKTIQLLSDSQANRSRVESLISQQNTDTLSQENRAVLAIIAFENIPHKLENAGKVLRDVLNTSITSLSNPESFSPGFFDKVKRIQKAAKTKAAIAKKIKDDLLGFVKGLDLYPDTMVPLLLWCRSELGPLLDALPPSGSTEAQQVALHKIKNLLINFDRA